MDSQFTLGVCGQIYFKVIETLFLQRFDISGTRGLKRHKEAHKVLKKAAKVCKCHFKGQRIKKLKNINFITSLCSFGIKNEEDSVF